MFIVIVQWKKIFIVGLQSDMQEMCFVGLKSEVLVARLQSHLKSDVQLPI